MTEVASKVVNADKLVAKIATWILTSQNGGHKIPSTAVIKMLQECSHTPGAASAAALIAQASAPRNVIPNWHCRPFIVDSSYQRTRQE
jgi:hypothetical protein